MSEPLALPWAPGLTAYDFGPGHPMNPVRLRLTVDLLDDLGLLDPERVAVLAPVPADEAVLALVHTPDHVAAVRAAGRGVADLVHGLGSQDTPVFPGMHEASALVVGATLTGARAVWDGPPRHAVSLAGGLHHAMPDHASGFCVYNDVAVAIRWLLSAGARRVAYVDLDAHHGDGVERVFWDDPRVLTISIHQSGASLFPGTGFPGDVGGPTARGSAVNVPFPARTGDAGWLRAVDAVVEPLVAVHAPDVLVTQHGCDSHRRDPLTDLDLTVEGLRAAALAMADLAARHAGGRWLATGGGGYAVADVVPRAWAHLVAIASGRPLDPAAPTPQQWRRRVADAGFRPPPTLGDGANLHVARGSAGYDREQPVDRAILAARNAAFPWHGLDPYSSW